MTKKFDAVAFMRLRREKIDQEDEGLTWIQKREKTRQLLMNDPLWQNLSNGRKPYSTTDSSGDLKVAED